MLAWLSTAKFADLAGISPRKARQAAARAFKPREPWRGAELAVRTVAGRGGRSGARYEISVASLPADLQARLNASQQAIEGPSKPRDAVSAEANRRLNIIAPIVAHSPHTAERRAAFKAVMAKTFIDPKGNSYSIPDTTLRRWERDYRAHGIRGLMPRERRDKDTRKAIISKAWLDAVAPLFDTATIERIDTHLRTYVRSLLAVGESPKRTRFRAGMKLKELTHQAGYTSETASLFVVPRRYIEDQRPWNKVAMRDRDAKAWHDMRPAIIRKLAPRPTEFDMDAMYFDHIVCREDGTPAYPRAVVWMCRATHRLRMDIYLLAAGEGTRGEHIAESVERGVAGWGVPERLTVDNGGEFKHIYDLADIIQLASQVHSIDGRRPIVTAQPYNARAKVVENGIGVLQRVWLSSLPGHVGNNRINRKTQQVGRATAPFPGTFEEFCNVVQVRVREYNAAPQWGKLNGRSPDEAYRAYIEAGFKVAMVDRASLLLAFSTRDTAKVGKFGIKVQGRWWRCEELDYRSGETIGVLKGRFRNWPMVPLFDLAEPNKIIGYAEPHEAVDGTDPANAKEGGRRVARFHARAREIAAIAPPADLIADTIASGAALPPPAVAPIGGTIIPNPRAAEIVAAMVESPDARTERERITREKRQQKYSDALDKFYANVMGNKR
jgi:hypothetical protein